MSFIKYIADESHYKEVLSLVGKAKQTVWIGTADILTDDPEMLETAIEQFDNVWIGKFFASSSINAARTVATIHCDDELGECHTFNRLPLHRNAPSPSQ